MKHGEPETSDRRKMDVWRKTDFERETGILHETGLALNYQAGEAGRETGDWKIVPSTITF